MTDDCSYKDIQDNIDVEKYLTLPMTGLAKHDFNSQSPPESMLLDEFSDSSDSDVSMGDSSSDTITKIEEMVLSFLAQLIAPTGNESDESEDTAPEPNTTSGKRAMPKIELQLADRTKNNNEENMCFKTLSYPRKCASGSAKPFAQLFRVLDITHEAIINKSPCTKRDIYYRDVALFKSQRVVDLLVDDLAATFEVERSDLNIRATSKGLICGSGLTIHLSSGESVQPNDTDGTLIPVGEDIKSFVMDSDVEWVLIIEKDAVFQTLCRMRLADHEDMPGRGLLITGKGYPDIATRHLVKSLADALPNSIPILAFVDGDPYGLDILSVYKYGSRGLRHESEKLAARRVKWLGIWASELASYGIDKEHMLPITKNDERKALALLQRSTSTLPAKWKKELMYLLHCRRKAEIEILVNIKLAHDGVHLSSGVVPAGARSITSSQISGPTITRPPPAPLMRYLNSKITDFVTRTRNRLEAITS